MHFPSARNTSLRHFRSFIAVADLNSLTHAAKALCVTPSALSLTIQQLEDNLGLKLFDRNTRRMDLTPAGAELQPAAERLLRQFESTVRDMRALSSLQKGQIRVAAVPSMLTLLLPDSVKEFTRLHAGIKIALAEETSRGVHASVLGGGADFGITSLWRASSELLFEPLLDDRYVVLFADDHPLASLGKSVGWAQLCEFPLVGFGGEASLREQLAEHPEVLSRIKLPAVRASDSSAIEAAVRAGMGIAIMPALSAQRPPLTRLKRKLVHGPVCSRTIGFLTRQGRSPTPAAGALMERVRSEIMAFHGKPCISVHANKA